VDGSATQQVSRRELVLRRYAKTGWLIVAIGVIVPVLAFAGAYRGWRLVRWGRRSEGLPLLLVGGAVFVVRIGLWASTGFTTAF
jgi:hypothetical protein